MNLIITIVNPLKFESYLNNIVRSCQNGPHLSPTTHEWQNWCKHIWVGSTMDFFSSQNKIFHKSLHLLRKTKDYCYI